MRREQIVALKVKPDFSLMQRARVQGAIFSASPTV
jgi:hypothetical protein